MNDNEKLVHYKRIHEQDLQVCIEQDKEIQKLKAANTLMGLKLTVATTALECIEDPRKLNHTERDDYTQKACLMNVAHVALKVMRGEHVEV